MQADCAFQEGLTALAEVLGDNWGGLGELGLSTRHLFWGNYRAYLQGWHLVSQTGCWPLAGFHELGPHRGLTRRVVAEPRGAVRGQRGEVQIGLEMPPLAGCLIGGSGRGKGRAPRSDEHIVRGPSLERRDSDASCVGYAEPAKAFLRPPACLPTRAWMLTTRRRSHRLPHT